LDAELADGVESITIDDVKNIAMKLNVKCGTRLLEDLDNNDKLKGNTVQLYASTLRTILSFQDDVNNTQTTESLSDLLHDDTIMMLNDRAEAK
jgi:hypothetical protein